jgi:hypothetical protein
MNVSSKTYIKDGIQIFDFQISRPEKQPETVEQNSDLGFSDAWQSLLHAADEPPTNESTTPQVEPLLDFDFFTQS